MIFFDGNYRLKPFEETEPTPIKQWSYSWRVRIINFELGQPDIQFLRPIVIFATQNGDRQWKTSCAESLGKRICRDFQLNVEQILWIEYFPADSEPLKAASFIPRSSMGSEKFYAVSWRSVRPNERAVIADYIPDIQEILPSS